MSFPIDGTIPNAPNDPADDQPIMRDNFNNTLQYLQVDHLKPGPIGNGFHAQSSYIARTVPSSLSNPINLTNSNGIAYVNSAKANDFYFYNGTVAGQNYPLNVIKAYGVFSGGVAPALINGFNITGVNRQAGSGGVGVYAVSFSQPTTTNYGWSIGIFDSTATPPPGVRAGVVSVKNANSVQILFSKIDSSGLIAFDPTEFTLTIYAV